MCVSHGSTEAETVSLDMGLRTQLLRRTLLGAAAAYLLPLIHQSLMASWWRTAYEVDASEEGGALVATKATLRELQSEASSHSCSGATHYGYGSGIIL